MSNAQNFGLSENEFQQYKQKLQKGDELLVEIIYRTHTTHCCHFLIKQCGASSDEARDATMEILWQFRQLLLKDKIKYGNMAGLFTLIAKRWYLRNKTNSSSSLDDFLTDNADIYENDHEVQHLLEYQEKYWINADIFSIDDHISQALKRALEELAEKCREIIKLRYVDEFSLEEICQIMGLASYDASKMQLMRCRKQFKIYFNGFFKS
jgi:RNA polymerase sigma factor (sigma-70 family)